MQVLQAGLKTPRRFINHGGAPFMHQLSQESTPRSLPRGDKAVESETVGRQPGDAQRRSHRGGPWNGFDPHPGSYGTAHQVISGIGYAGSAGVGNEGDGLAAV